MDHTYEEIRAAALDILAGRETRPPYAPNQYEYLSIAVAEVFARREKRAEDLHGSRHAFRLSGADADLFLEVFWELFRQGIITLGLNNSNREFPFCRLSRFGKRLVDNQLTQVLIETGRREYNEERPKQGLGGLTPAQYAKRLVAERSTVTLEL